MTKQARLFAFAALLMIGVVACGPSGAPGGSDPAPAADPGMTLDVRNHNVLDMRVFLVRDGQRLRVGTVPSMTRQVFQVSPEMLGGALQLQLVADPIGSRDAFSTPPITVETGATIEWQVENDLSFSSVRLR